MNDYVERASGLMVPASVGSDVAHVAGTCSICGCTEDNACFDGSATCDWAPGFGETLCTFCESEMIEGQPAAFTLGEGEPW
jgi:hypothetical protein